MKNKNIDITLELVKKAFEQTQNTNSKEYERLIKLINKRKEKNIDE